MAGVPRLLSGFPAPGMTVISREQGRARAGLIPVFRRKISVLAHRSKFSDLYFSICKDKSHTARESQVLLGPMFGRQSVLHKHKIHEHSIVLISLDSSDVATHF